MKKSWWIDFDTYDGGYTVGPDGEEPVVVVFADNRSEKPNKRKLLKAIKTAALISASPELLDVLKDMFEEFKQYDIANAPGSSFEVERRRLIRKAALVIAKAEGRSDE